MAGEGIGPFIISAQLCAAADGGRVDFVQTGDRAAAAAAAAIHLSRSI
jgi:hypothetical protein